MGAQFEATLDFGAFPGSSVTSVDVVAVGVVSTSAIEAWIRPVATADHTDIDHVAAPMRIVATYLSDDNVRIYGLNTSDVMPPEEFQTIRTDDRGLVRVPQRQATPMFVGLFNVWGVWN